VASWPVKVRHTAHALDVLDSTAAATDRVLPKGLAVITACASYRGRTGPHCSSTRRRFCRRRNKIIHIT